MNEGLVFGKDPIIPCHLHLKAVHPMASVGYRVSNRIGVGIQSAVYDVSSPITKLRSDMVSASVAAFNSETASTLCLPRSLALITAMMHNRQGH